jgi:hypothetical protein
MWIVAIVPNPPIDVFRRRRPGAASIAQLFNNQSMSSGFQHYRAGAFANARVLCSAGNSAASANQPVWLLADEEGRFG